MTESKIDEWTLDVDDLIWPTPAKNTLATTLWLVPDISVTGSCRPPTPVAQLAWGQGIWQARESFPQSHAAAFQHMDIYSRGKKQPLTYILYLVIKSLQAF